MRTGNSQQLRFIILKQAESSQLNSAGNFETFENIFSTEIITELLFATQPNHVLSKINMRGKFMVTIK